VLTSTAAGLATGLSLIVAIGAQNAYVLRQGVVRSHVLLVVTVCAVSDLILIAAGVGGVGSLGSSTDVVLTVLRWFGVAFLVGYAVMSLRRSLRPGALEVRHAEEEPARRVLGRALALTWLNPHVYLDTVVLLGSVAAAYDHAGGGRWWFALGAMLGSVVWFSGLGYGARLLSPLLARRRSWQVLDVLVALTMLVIAAKLALG
jgi:L-lysine exporter family protein LysE/ArgO